MNFTQFINVTKARLSIMGKYFSKNDKEKILPTNNEDNFSFATTDYDKATKNIVTSIEEQDVSFLLEKEKSFPFKKDFNFLNKDVVINDKFWDSIIYSHDNATIKEIFFNQEKLKDIIPNKKLDLIIDKYKDSVCNMPTSMEVSFNFLKEYSHGLSKESTIKLIKNAVEYYTASNDLEQEAIKLVKEKYDQNIKLFIPKKQDVAFINKSKKEWLNLLYDKLGHNMNDKLVMLDIVKVSTDDVFLFHYLTKFFENNNDVELKKQVVNNLGILNSDNRFNNTLVWIIDNGLLSEIVNNKEVAKKIFAKPQNNYLVPLLIEKYHLPHNEIIKSTISSQFDNEELFNFIFYTYDLTAQTQQQLCQGIYHINSEKLAHEMFKIGVIPLESDTEIFKAQPNEAGNILLKSYLKHKLENKYTESNKAKTKTRKI